MNPVAIAMNRFGLGVRADEPLPEDPRRWLLSQLDRFESSPMPWQSVRRTPALVQSWLTQQHAVRAVPEGERSGIREAYLREARRDYLDSIGARVDCALQTREPFVERLVHFWANHFAVSVDKLLVIGLAGGFEADAIRPHVLGRFEDLLLAVIRHPAMLLYLDQAASIGPGSMAGRPAEGRQQRSRGLNENLAREILELHTLGVRSSYSQDDVTELARALTGWTLPNDEQRAAGDSFRFVPALHEPGTRTVLGRSYAGGGESQARAILHDLARAPATARHVATKLVRHFVSDDPPQGLVRQLADAFDRTEGDLPSVYRALAASKEAWQPPSPKFKTPWEWSVSSLRAIGRREIRSRQAATLMNQLGQPVWRPGSPAGYDDLSAAWAAPDALMRRVEVAQRIATENADAEDARTLATRVLPGVLSEVTAGAIARAESQASALALLLVSPEFLRR
jgi:uncharacterized protein (DUF1800 family)